MNSIFILKTLISAIVISFSSWLAKFRPSLAGLILALPLTSLLALAMSYLEHKDSQSAIEFAKSTFVAIPISLLFFIPFLLASKFQLNFWTCYLLGIFLLVLGFFLHQFTFKFLS